MRNAISAIKRIKHAACAIPNRRPSRALFISRFRVRRACGMHRPCGRAPGSFSGPCHLSRMARMS